MASISYEVSDDSLSRLVARIGCRVSPRPHVHSTVGRPIGGAGWPGALAAVGCGIDNCWDN